MLFVTHFFPQPLHAESLKRLHVYMPSYLHQPKICMDLQEHGSSSQTPFINWPHYIKQKGDRLPALCVSLKVILDIFLILVLSLTERLIFCFYYELYSVLKITEKRNKFCELDWKNLWPKADKMSFKEAMTPVSQTLSAAGEGRK